MNGRNFNNRVCNKIVIIIPDDYLTNPEASSESETDGGSNKRKNIKSMPPLMHQLNTAIATNTDKGKE